MAAATQRIYACYFDEKTDTERACHVVHSCSLGALYCDQLIPGTRVEFHVKGPDMREAVSGSPVFFVGLTARIGRSTDLNAGDKTGKSIYVDLGKDQIELPLQQKMRVITPHKQQIWPKPNGLLTKMAKHLRLG